MAGKDAPPERLEMDAVCTIFDDEPKTITVDLNVRARCPSLSEEEEFESAVHEAEQLCPVSNTSGATWRFEYKRG